MQIANARGRLGRLGDGPGFIQGAELWMTPGAAFSAAQAAVTSPSTSFSGDSLAYNLGVLAVPIGLLVLVLGMGGGRRRFGR
jgi:hypothetical protein